MSQISPKLRKAEGGYSHYCPGCDEMHYIAVERPLANGAQWTFNGDVNSPSFTPSVHIRTGRAVLEGFVPEPGDPPEVCHYILTDGVLNYCGDTTHGHAGQSVVLPDIPAAWSSAP